MENKTHFCVQINFIAMKKKTRFVVYNKQMQPTGM